MEEHAEQPRYVLIWFVLLVLTLGEVGYAFLDLPKVWLATGLIIMALYKALLVAMYYMHLRYEPRRLWVLAAFTASTCADPDPRGHYGVLEKSVRLYHGHGPTRARGRAVVWITRVCAWDYSWLAS